MRIPNFVCWRLLDSFRGDDLAQAALVGRATVAELESTEMERLARDPGQATHRLARVCGFNIERLLSGIAVRVCSAVCGNGGATATYTCGTGFYASGAQCSGTGTSDTQICTCESHIVHVHRLVLHVTRICSLQLQVRDLHHECDELCHMRGHQPWRCSNLRVQCGFLRQRSCQLCW